MTTSANSASNRGRLFGIPLGDFGLFTSLLLSFSAAFTAFFLATFLGIFTLLIYNQSGRHSVNYADSYRLVGLPSGLTVLAASLVFFGYLWIRRKLSGR
jgi:hypothetical protein